MLARTGGLDGPFGVAGMRYGDIDRVDLGIGQQGIIAVHDARAWEIRGEIGLVGIARGNGGEHAMPGAGDATLECLGNAAWPDNAPADFLVGHSLRSLNRPHPAMGDIVVFWTNSWRGRRTARSDIRGRQRSRWPLLSKR